MLNCFVRAADISKWSGAVTEAQWAAARDQCGIGLAIVGSWHGREANHDCVASLRAADSVGLLTATYLVLNSLAGADSVSRAQVACGTLWPSLTFAALDMELRGVSETIVEEAADAVRVARLRPLIYTGSWFWRGRLDNPGWAADLPLWDSRYDGRQVLDFPEPYGPWTEIVGKQYRGTNTALGFSCDLSVFDANWLSSRGTPKGDT